MEAIPKNLRRFQIVKLEERIAPSFMLIGTPGDEAAPPGPRGQGDIGPSTPGAGTPPAVFPAEGNLAAWNAVFNSPVLDFGPN